MKNIYIIQLFCALSIVMLGCTHEVKSINGLDHEKWKNDINGCLGYRKSTKPLLEIDRELISGLNEEQIAGLFGKPNKTELYERGQKFFIYTLTCTEEKEVHTMRIRFNALGMVNETLFLID